MLNELECCKICPRNCSVNRNDGKKGYCKCDDKIKIALVSTHYYEEPCISGKISVGDYYKDNNCAITSVNNVNNSNNVNNENFVNNANNVNNCNADINKIVGRFWYNFF